MTCECIEPVRHSCGGFGQFARIIGYDDVYRCFDCGVFFRIPCRLEEVKNGTS